MTHESIRRRLARLRYFDRRFAVFGANGHRYRRRRVTEADLRVFEAAIGTRLPEDYRDHLIAVGSGIGPYYGLMHPSESLREFESTAEVFDAIDRSRPSPARPFPIDHRPCEHQSLAMKYPCDGAIVIADHGCTSQSVIVTSGQLVGTIWDVEFPVIPDGSYTPSVYPPGIARKFSVRQFQEAPPSFMTWYAAWLDRSLRDVRPIWRCR